MEDTLSDLERQYSVMFVELYAVKNDSFFSKNIKSIFSLESDKERVRFKSKDYEFCLYDRQMKQEGVYWHEAAKNNIQASFKGTLPYFDRFRVINGVLTIDNSALYVEFIMKYVFSVKTPEEALLEYTHLIDDEYSSNLDCVLRH